VQKRSGEAGRGRREGTGTKTVRLEPEEGGEDEGDVPVGSGRDPGGKLDGDPPEGEVHIH
jgi:hypothetical protein